MPICESERLCISDLPKSLVDACHISHDCTPLESQKQLSFFTRVLLCPPKQSLWERSLYSLSSRPSVHATIKTTLQKVRLLTSTKLRRIQIPVLSTKINKHLEHKE